MHILLYDMYIHMYEYSHRNSPNQVSVSERERERERERKRERERARQRETAQADDSTVSPGAVEQHISAHADVSCINKRRCKLVYLALSSPVRVRVQHAREVQQQPNATSVRERETAQDRKRDRVTGVFA